jgi:hypothetical protein
VKSLRPTGDAINLQQQPQCERHHAAALQHASRRSNLLFSSE